MQFLNIKPGVMRT